MISIQCSYGISQRVERGQHLTSARIHCLDMRGLINDGRGCALDASSPVALARRLWGLKEVIAVERPGGPGDFRRRDLPWTVG